MLDREFADAFTVGTIKTPLFEPVQLQNGFPDGLAGNRAGMDTGSPNGGRLNYRHIFAQLCRLDSSMMPRRTCTNNNQIVLLHIFVRVTGLPQSPAQLFRN